MEQGKVSVKTRVSVAALVALCGAWIIFSTYLAHPKFTSDFGQWHLAAKVVLNGDDPYLTLGPHGMRYEWPTLFVYPLTVVFVSLPFVWLSEPVAATAFVFISTFVMVMGITRKGFYLLPLAITIPFQMSVTLGQLSLLLTAAVAYPALAFLTVVKPQAGLPLAATIRDRRTFILAAGIGVLLVASSLALIPRWPLEWLEIIRNDKRYLPPITRVGGFLILLVLLRWKRRESWLLLVMALLPQSLTFYCVLPLFTIPKNFTESLSLAAVSTLGIYLGAALMPDGISGMRYYEWSGNVVMLSVYLPCLILILLRENSARD